MAKNYVLREILKIINYRIKCCAFPFWARKGNKRPRPRELLLLLVHAWFTNYWLLCLSLPKVKLCVVFRKTNNILTATRRVLNSNEMALTTKKLTERKIDLIRFISSWNEIDRRSIGEKWLFCQIIIDG